jgi:Polysaccharide lyase/Carbohydrate binding module (family 6)/Putative Ig domain
VTPEAFNRRRTVAMQIAIVLSMMFAIVGCGGTTDSAVANPQAPPAAAPPAAPPPANPPPVTNQPPTISGAPPDRIGVGSRYEFRPHATDPEGASLSFSVDNKPPWLSFDGSTGALSGTPAAADVGAYRNIVIGVTDGNSAASLPAFVIDVHDSAAPLPAPQTAVSVPAVIEAENFDGGGEGVGYHDNTVANIGGLYRSAEGVDIIASPDAVPGNFVINDFETGEWLAYAIDVPTAGSYELALKAATVFTDGAYHFEIDGHAIGDRTAVPNTGSWSTFQWSAAATVDLTAGRHVLAIVADQQYFDLDSFRVATAGTTPVPPLPQPLPQPPPLPSSLPLPDPSTVAFACPFVGLFGDCGFQEQAKVPGRAGLTNLARDGASSIRLHTEPGDNNVAGSDTMERDDLWLSQAATDGYEGHEAWWAHSILFPDDFTVPTWHPYVVFDFHNTAPGAWQANFHVAFQPQADISKPGVLSFIGYGGVNSGDGRYTATIGPVQKNVWYDFVYHVRWSSGPDGFFEAWVNGAKKLSHQGPTLYAGQGVYLKLANYHVPVCDPYPACIGTHSATSVIHDRVIRSSAPAAVAAGPIEGVLELVNGALTPVLP